MRTTTELVERVLVHHLVSRTGTESFDGSYETLLVEVRSSQGVVGLGEAESMPVAVRAVIEGPGAHSKAKSLRESVLGLGACDALGAHERMYADTESIGRRGLVMHAIGAVDIALWDLQARLQQVPVWHLIGPRVHERVRVYASSYPTPWDLEEWARCCTELRRRRFTGVKLFVDERWLADLDHARRLVTAAVQTFGEVGPVLVDGALSFRDRDTAHVLARLFADEGVDIFEAPLPLDDVVGHAELAGCGVALGVGDLGLTHVEEWRDMIDRGHADVFQPDPSNVGGVTGMLAVGALADEHGIRVVPHGYRSRITFAANLHVVSTRTEPPLAEYCVSASPIVQELTREPFDLDEEGCVIVPDTPGLGVSLDPSVLDRLSVKRSSS